MAENIQRNRGRGQGYKFDRGGTPAEFGPYIGVVKNNVDTLRAGRLQVYIEEFGGTNEDDSSLWRTVAYVPPFYGVVQQSGTDQGAGTYVGNPQSYGMWFTPPDLDTRVICFFAGGDPNQGYYTGCIPDLGINHMIPAVGASTQFKADNSAQAPYFSGATQLPVTELNTDNQAVDDNPKFYDQVKPVHSYTAAVMLQQGLINDTVRGPITSNSQRESPSTVYGVSTPGRPITQGNVNEDNFADKVNSKDLKDDDIKVIGRRGGHSIVLDDGNAEGYDNLVRIRTGKGHQILLSDDGDCFHIIHASGQTWLEFGSEGTVDVFATNSVNVRTQGELNLHADSRINLYGKEEVNIKSKKIRINATSALDLVSERTLSMSGSSAVSVDTDGYLAMNSAVGGWNSSGALGLNGARIDLNSGISVPNVLKPKPLPDFELPDVKFIPGQGWVEQSNRLKSIVTRAPTHEPYPYHNRGVEVRVRIDEGTSTIATDTPVSNASAELVNVPVTNPVTPAQVLKQQPAVDEIGNLSTMDVTGLKTSTEVAVNQGLSEVSTANGIGKYGISPGKLENLGILKPGTLARFGSDSAVLEIIDNPSIWTGKLGITSVENLLNNDMLQGSLQESVMQLGHDRLRQIGVITGRETVEQVAGLVQSATQYTPVEIADWAAGLSEKDVKVAVDTLSKNAYQAVDIVANDLTATAVGIVNNATGAVTGLVNEVTGNITKLADEAAGIAEAVVNFDPATLADLTVADIGSIVNVGLSFFGAGSSSLPVNLFGSLNTVSRQALNNEVVNIIGNPKVLPPSYVPRRRSPDGSVETIDIRVLQREARNQAIRSALDRGESVQSAEAAGQVAGNLAGADALRSIKL